jgi:methylthioribose-1-phosphate isomerase
MEAETRRDPGASAPEDFSPLRWDEGALLLLDQTRLPAEEVWMRCMRPDEIADAIRRLAVRGAPAIGVAAAYGLALAARGAEDAGGQAAQLSKDAVGQADQLIEGAGGQAARLAAAEALLGATRPTAVNLRWALAQGRRVFEESRDRGPAAAA